MINEKDRKQAKEWVEKIHDLELEDDRIIKELLNGCNKNGGLKRMDIKTERKYLKNKLKLLYGVDYDYEK